MAQEFKPTDPLDHIKRDIMELILAYESGISEAELSRTMSSTAVEVRMNAINALTNEGKVQLCKRGSDLIYRAIDSKTSANHSAVNNSNISIEERAVYHVVESAGCKGIWNREIRNQTKLPLNQMTKVLKNLETKKLIKAVKSVTASKKKLYMLYGLEPDKSVTGGAWYSGTEFESEYVQILHEQCYQFVKRRLTPPEEMNHDFVAGRNYSLVSSIEVKDYIDELKISNVKLTLQDIEMVLETIVFDGLIEKITVVRKGEIPQVATAAAPATTTASPSATLNEQTSMITSDDEEPDTSQVSHHYRALAKLVESSGAMRVPCGQCPYIHECRPGAVITPEKCLYFERWFSK